MADKVLSLKEFADLERQARGGDERAKELLYADLDRTMDPGARIKKIGILQNPSQR